MSLSLQTILNVPKPAAEYMDYGDTKMHCRPPTQILGGQDQSWGLKTAVLWQDRSQTCLGLGLGLKILVLFPSLVMTPRVLPP